MEIKLMKRFSFCDWCIVIPVLFLLCTACIYNTSTPVVADANGTITVATDGIATSVIVAAKKNTLVQNSVKLLYTADIASDMVYKILGDMYKHGYFTESQKDRFVKMGDAIVTTRRLSNEALIAYMWAVENSDESEQARTKEVLINTLVKFAKAFYAMKDDVASTYNDLTGQNLKIPDIFMFDTITSLLYQ